MSQRDDRDRRPPRRSPAERPREGPERSEGARRRAGVLAATDELEVTIEKLVAGGDGLARVEGIPLFVPRSAPGDRVRIRLVERRPDYARAEVIEILTPGPGRRSAPCPHFARCGGCDLQHLEDDLQVRLKVESVVETLRRIGRLTLPTELRVVAGEPWGYRLRTQLQVRPRETGSALVGYHARGSRELVPVDSCPVLAPPLEAALSTLPAALGAAPPARLDLATDGERLSTAPPIAALAPAGELSVEAAGERYRFDARCFFQAHRQLLPQLIGATVEEWTGGIACDLYAGVGLFSLPLGRRYERVVAVEGDRIAARYARRNAREAGLEQKVAVINRAVESALREIPPGLDRVVVDPPRAGLSWPVRSWMVRQGRPQRITYTSCHAATLARDLAELTADYDLEKLAFVDLFPQTGHLEVVAQLRRR